MIDQFDDAATRCRYYGLSASHGLGYDIAESFLYRRMNHYVGCPIEDSEAWL